MWAGFPPQAELLRRTGISFIAAIVVVAILVANHAGYLPHPVGKTMVAESHARILKNLLRYNLHLLHALGRV